MATLSASLVDSEIFIKRLFFRAAGLAALAGMTAFWSQPTLADEICGAAEEQYVQKIAAGMQQFAKSVTNTGSFVVNEQHPGNGTAFLLITFNDRGKVLFVHRVQASPQASATTARPGKTKAGDPGLAVSLVQGNLGSCEYAIFVRDGRFVVSSRGLKHADKASATGTMPKGDQHRCPKGYSWQETSGGPGRPNYMSCLRNVGPTE